MTGRFTRRCTSFGEAAIMIANDSNVFGKTNFFKCFYNGFTENSTIWFAYHDDNNVRITGVSDPRGGGVNRVANSLSNLGLKLLA